MQMGAKTYREELDLDLEGEPSHLDFSAPQPKLPKLESEAAELKLPEPSAPQAISTPLTHSSYCRREWAQEEEEEEAEHCIRTRLLPR